MHRGQEEIGEDGPFMGRSRSRQKMSEMFGICREPKIKKIGQMVGDDVIINPLVSTTLFCIMFYLYGFSVGAREHRFFLYGLLFLVLGWIPQTINLTDPELQYGLTHDVTLPGLGIAAFIAVGITIIFLVAGYLSGVYYRKREETVKR